MVALARAYGERPVSLNELAESESISLSYLEQLFAELRKAGLVTAVRGAYGGYRLARPPEEITVGDVVRPLEPVSLTSCAEPGASRDCCTRRPGLRGQRLLAERQRPAGGSSGQHHTGRPGRERACGGRRWPRRGGGRR